MYVGTGLCMAEGPCELQERSVLYPGMCLLPAGLLPALVTMAPWGIPNEPRKKKVTSGLQMALQVLLAPAGIELLGHFSPTRGQGTMGKAALPREQNWEWSTLYTLPGRRAGLQGRCLPYHGSSCQFESTVCYMKGGLGKRC